MAEDSVIQYREIKELDRIDTINNNQLLLIDDLVEETKAITYEKAIKKIYTDVYSKLPKWIKGIPEDYNNTRTQINSETNKTKIISKDEIINKHCRFYNSNRTRVSSGEFCITFNPNDENKEFFFFIYVSYNPADIYLKYTNGNSFNMLERVSGVALNGWYRVVTQAMDNGGPKYPFLVKL